MKGPRATSLCSRISSAEYGRRRPDGSPGRERFPLKLRDALSRANPPVATFNPRGTPLRDIPAVQELLGNVLDCLDPDESILASLRETQDEDGNFKIRYRQNGTTLANWRAVARAARGNRPRELSDFIECWGTRAATRQINTRRARVSLNDIIFKLIKWLPNFQSDIEHLAWLEAVQRAVTSSAVLGGFAGNILFKEGEIDDDLSVRSVIHAYQRVLFPIAEDLVEISEDTLDTLSRDRLNIMTIHQAKGLEFPITIVDVGTAMEDLRWIKARSRFPTAPDSVHKMEAFFRPYSNIGLPNRSGLDRAFDDLVRNYFVAFSRAQDVLILAGHTKSEQRAHRRKRDPGRHVGTGWIRSTTDDPNDADWPWEGMAHIARIKDDQR